MQTWSEFICTFFKGHICRQKRDISQPLTLKISPAASPLCSVMHCQPPSIPTLRATAGPAHRAAATGSVFQPAPASQCSLKENLSEPGCFGAPLRIKGNKSFFYITCHSAWVKVSYLWEHLPQRVRETANLCGIISK